MDTIDPLMLTSYVLVAKHCNGSEAILTHFGTIFETWSQHGLACESCPGLARKQELVVD